MSYEQFCIKLHSGKNIIFLCSKGEWARIKIFLVIKNHNFRKSIFHEVRLSDTFIARENCFIKSGKLVVVKLFTVKTK